MRQKIKSRINTMAFVAILWHTVYSVLFMWLKEPFLILNNTYSRNFRFLFFFYFLLCMWDRLCTTFSRCVLHFELISDQFIIRNRRKRGERMPSRERKVIFFSFKFSGDDFQLFNFGWNVDVDSFFFFVHAPVVDNNLSEDELDRIFLFLLFWLKEQTDTFNANNNQILLL